MAGDNPAVLIDQDRVCKAKLANRAGELGELVLWVRAGVARVGHEIVDGSVDHGEGGDGRGSAGGASASDPTKEPCWGMQSIPI